MDSLTGSIIATAIIMTSSPSEKAKEKALIATFKQTGLEDVVRYNTDRYINPTNQKMIGYTYQFVVLMKNKEVVFGFSF